MRAHKGSIFLQITPKAGHARCIHCCHRYTTRQRDPSIVNPRPPIVGKRLRHFVNALSFRAHNFDWQRNGVVARENLYGHGRFPIPGPNLGVGRAIKTGIPGSIVGQNRKLVEPSCVITGVIIFRYWKHHPSIPAGSMLQSKHSAQK